MSSAGKKTGFVRLNYEGTKNGNNETNKP